MRKTHRKNHKRTKKRCKGGTPAKLSALENAIQEAERDSEFAQNKLLRTRTTLKNYHERFPRREYDTSIENIIKHKSWSKDKKIKELGKAAIEDISKSRKIHRAYKGPEIKYNHPKFDSIAYLYAARDPRLGPLPVGDGPPYLKNFLPAKKVHKLNYKLNYKLKK